MPQKSIIVKIDPSMQYERELHYKERHAPWEIYKAIFWGFYLLIIGVVLATLVPAVFSYTAFFGLTIVLLALFLIIFGFTKSLHLMLMKKYA
ncbi:MAG: hypothetical protein KGH66_03375 [Candidatus Micrarchaeota archaeon]|nr:hypothetical protein [Candidatus Micrarchaeota archaeon]